jgi:hypothetical protein
MRCLQSAEHDDSMMPVRKRGRRLWHDCDENQDLELRNQIPQTVFVFSMRGDAGKDEGLANERST